MQKFIYDALRPRQRYFAIRNKNLFDVETKEQAIYHNANTEKASETNTTQQTKDNRHHKAAARKPERIKEPTQRSIIMPEKQEREVELETGTRHPPGNRKVPQYESCVM